MVWKEEEEGKARALPACLPAWRGLRVAEGGREGGPPVRTRSRAETTQALDLQASLWSLLA